MPGKKGGQPLHFPVTPLAELRGGRIGKHSKMVSEILSDLKKLDEYSALKIDWQKRAIRKQIYVQPYTEPRRKTM